MRNNGPETLTVGCAYNLGAVIAVDGSDSGTCSGKAIEGVELDLERSLERALAHRPDHRRALLGIGAARIAVKVDARTRS